MRKRVLKLSVIALILLMILGWVPITYLYVSSGTRLSDDPIEEHLPKGLSRIVYTYFEPSMADTVSKLSFHQSQHKTINVLQFNAAGIYDPVMNRIALVAQNEQDSLVVHEILHHVWFQRLVPNQAEFDASFKRLCVDAKYAAFGAYVQSQWDWAKKHGEPSPLRETELYSYLGDFLVRDRYFTEQTGRGLPEYMARHYRGVLRAGFSFDYSVYGPKETIAWGCINALYQDRDVTRRLVTHVESLAALHSRGGVIGWQISNHRWEVKRLAHVVAIDELEQALLPGVHPNEVQIQIIGFGPHPLIFARGRGGRRSIIGRAEYLNPSGDGWNWYKTDLPTLHSLRAAYVAGELLTLVEVRTDVQIR